MIRHESGRYWQCEDCGRYIPDEVEAHYDGLVFVCPACARQSERLEAAEEQEWWK